MSSRRKRGLWSADLAGIKKEKKSQTAKNQKKEHEEERGKIYLEIENLLISLHY